METFANIHWILDNGGAAYANLGTKQSTGTKLVSLDSFFNSPGMYEIEMGTELHTVFEEFGKGCELKSRNSWVDKGRIRKTEDEKSWTMIDFAKRN